MSAPAAASPSRLALLVAEREPLALGFRYALALHAPAASLVVDELHLFRAQPAANDRTEPLAKGRLVDPVLIGVHRALHHALPEPVRRADKHHVTEAGLRVEREDHAGAPQIGAHHLLDSDGERDLQVIEAVLGAVRDRAVREQRGETAVHRVEEVLLSAYVQITLLLAGEARAGKVLRGGAAPHRHVAACAVLALQAPIGRDDRVLESGRERRP